MRETLALRAYEQRAANVVILEALAAGLPPVFADPHQIQQMLLNLIINAEQAMLDAHGRGMLILRSWHDPDRDAVILEVNDDGPGVPEDDAAEDLRSVLHDEGGRQGHGARTDGGLRHRAGARRPDQRSRRAEGRGASFFLELPVSGAERAAARAARRRSRCRTCRTGTRALVIEDEQALGEAVAAALADEGFDVDRAAERRGGARAHPRTRTTTS